MARFEIEEGGQSVSSRRFVTRIDSARSARLPDRQRPRLLRQRSTFLELATEPSSLVQPA